MIKTYWRQGAEIIFAVLVGKACSAIWKVLLARLGPEQFGTVQIGLTAFYTIGSFGLLGFHTALMRFASIASHKRQAVAALPILRLSVKIVLTLSLLLFAGFLLFPAALPALVRASAPAVRLAEPYLWIAPVLAVSELLWSYLAATGSMRQYAVAKYIGTPVFRLILFALLALLGRFAVPFLFLHIGLSSLLAFAVSAWLVFRHAGKTGWNGPADPKFLPYAGAMSGSFLAFVLYGTLDVFFAARFLGPGAVGLLAAIGLLTQDPYDALFAPLLNIIPARLGPLHRDPRAGFSFIRMNIGIFLLAGAVMATGIYFLRYVLVSYILGSSYLTAIPLIGFFLLAHLIDTAIILPLRHFLDFYGYVRVTLVLMVAALVTKAAIGVVAVPLWGLWGILMAQALAIMIHLSGALIVSFRVMQKRDGK